MGSAAYFSALPWAHIAEITGGNFGAFDAPCPVCSPDRKPRHQRLKVLRVWREADDFARFNCVHCLLKGVVFRDGPALASPRDWAAEERRRAEVAAAAERERADHQAHAEFVFFSAKPIDGTLAETYLSGRGLVPGADLRFSAFAPRGYAEDAASAPAMVAAVRDTAGALTGIQATFLDPLGRKAGRTSFGTLGGAVRLAEIGPDGVLGIAEGTETALAFSRLYGLPCWSTLGTGGLRRFEPPRGVRRLVIAADNDPDGMDAAHSLAKRLCAVCEVHISAPAQPGDWNDLLQVAA